MKAPSRAQARRQRGLLISLGVVLVLTLGSLAGTLAARWSPRLGLDLAGGFSVVYVPEHHVSNADLNETVTILSDRVNGLGVSGAQVNTQGDQIVVQVPGVKNANAVLKAVGQTAQLYFRPTLCYAPLYHRPKNPSSVGALPTNCPAQYQLTTTSPLFGGSVSSPNGVGYSLTPDPALAAYPLTTSATPPSCCSGFPDHRRCATSQAPRS